MSGFKWLGRGSPWKEYRIFLNMDGAIRVEDLDGKPVGDWDIKRISGELSRHVLSHMAHVYLLRPEYENIYKIGYTCQPIKKRISQIATAEKKKMVFLGAFPCPSTEIARDLEIILHSIYKPWRIRGEWYGVDPEEITRLRSHRTGIELLNHMLPLWWKHV